MFQYIYYNRRKIFVNKMLKYSTVNDDCDDFSSLQFFTKIYNSLIFVNRYRNNRTLFSINRNVE